MRKDFIVYILLLWIYVCIFTLSVVLLNLVHTVLIFDNITPSHKTFVVPKVKPLKELTGHADSLDRTLPGNVSR